MAPYGLSTSGLTIPRLTDVLADIVTSEQTTFGVGINTMVTSFLGQFNGMFAEREELIWQLVLSVYNNFDPNNAGGVSLDNVVAITGIKRLPATAGSNGINPCFAYGVLGTVIPAGSIVSVNGTPASQFATTADVTLGAGTNCVQTVTFSATPDAGNWTLVYNGNSTGSLAFNASTAVIAAALNSIVGLSGVTVSGTYGAGLVITFTTASGQQPQPILQIGINTLTHIATPVVVTVTMTTPGVLPNVAVNVVCTQTGAIVAYANSLTVINTPVAGWTAFNNPNDIIPGENIETDAALRLRRETTIAFPGSSNPDAIVSKVRNITGVLNAIIDNNVTLITNGNGTPGKAFQVVVLGGANQTIGDTIWANGPAGIQSYGTTTVTVLDVSNNPQSVSFSRPTPVPIYVIVTLHALADYPVGGDAAVKQSIANYGTANFSVGQNVIAWKLNLPLDPDLPGGVAGIDNLSFMLGIAPSPTLDVDIPISALQISTWDTANISIVHI